MRKFALTLLLTLSTCAALPHAIERGIAYDYRACAKGKMQGGPSERECAKDSEAKCKDAKLHESCFYDYAWEKKP